MKTAIVVGAMIIADSIRPDPYPRENGALMLFVLIIAVLCDIVA